MFDITKAIKNCEAFNRNFNNYKQEIIANIEKVLDDSIRVASIEGKTKSVKCFKRANPINITDTVSTDIYIDAETLEKLLEKYRINGYYARLDKLSMNYESYKITIEW